MLRGSLFGALALLCSGALAQQTIDGTADYQYGPPIVCQNVQTGFGDNLSELDVAYAYVKSGVLYLALAGNLENNSNKLNIFIDSVSGGQNRLRGDNWKDFSGTSWYLTRLGDSGGPNGLKFEAGFTADHYFGINRNGGNLYLDYSATPDTANNIGFYLGQSNLTDGTLSGGTNLYGVKANYDGSNTVGTGSGSSTGYALGGTVKTGLEMAIPLAAIGNPSGTIRICAFVGNSDNSFLSNQFLPGVGYNGGTVNNYGEPRGVDLGGTGSNTGLQYFVAPYAAASTRIVLAKVGGTASTTSAVTLEEYDVSGGSGSSIQNIALPSTGGGNKTTLSGTATTEGQLQRSSDGRYLVIGGYDLASGGTIASTVRRNVAFISAVGGYDGSTGGVINQTMRGAFSFDGSGVWTADNNSSAGVKYWAFGSATSATVGAVNSRATVIFNNQLYCSAQATLNSIGIGLPQTSGTATAVLSSLSDLHDFYFADALTLYIADQSNGLVRYTYNGTIWTSATALGFATTGGVRSVCGTKNSSNQNVLYVTATSNKVYRVVDDGSATTTLMVNTTPGAVYRGVEMSVLNANSAPTLTVPANATISEGDNYAANATATDPDSGQTLTFSKVSGPAALTVSSGGAISWTPGESDGGGVYTVTVKVEDNGSPVASDTKSFDITVNESNQNPVLDNPGTQSASENSAFSVQLTGSDADLPAQTLTYGLVSGPSGLTVSGSGLVQWTPGESDGGTSPSVTVSLSDGNATVQQSFTINVAETNEIPVLADPADGSVNEGVLDTRVLSATDADLPAQTLTYSLVSGPGSITGNTWSWTPGESDGGQTFTVTVKVEDDFSPVASHTQSFDVTVNETNQAPILTDPADHSVNEGVLDSVTLSATDDDLPGQTLTYALVSGPGAVVGNQWSWTPDETNGGNTYTVTVSVTDGTDTVQQSFDVTVTEVNQAPVLDDPADHSVNEGALDSVTLSATDADLPGQTLTYALVSGPGSVTGNTWSWTPDETNGGNTYTVTVSVTDGIDTVQQSFDVTVNETNENPVLADPADGSVNEGVLDTRVLSATDADLPAQTLTYSLVSGPGSVTGNTWSWTPGESDGGTTATIVVKVEDNFSPVGSHTQSFQVTVNETNQPPVLTDPADHSVNEGVLDSVTLSASDADVPVQTLTYALVSGPGSVTGNTWTWTPGESDGPGVYNVTVSVTDGIDTVQQTFQVTVNEVNQAPVLDDPADQNIDEMVLATVTLNATDADLPGQTLTYGLVSGPGAVSGSSWTWTPGEADGPGTYTVVVSVTDGIDTVQQSFQVNVAEANVAPILAAIGNQSVDELQTLSFTATATDADVPAQTLHFSLAGDVPAGATITDGGVFSWTPTEAQGPGTYTFDVVVKDFVGLVDGGQDSETITVTVDEVNVAPVLDPVGNQSVDELVQLSFTATAGDSDLPGQTLTFSLSGAPQGAAISSGGAFTWTPTEAQGPGVFTFDVVVSDGNLTDSETITVTVAEVNVDPTLADPSGPPIPEGDTFTTQLMGEDTDVPTQTLSYSKISGPAALTVSPTGAVSWLTTEADGPGTYPVTVEVTDGAGGSAQRTFDIVVEEVNVAPVLGAIGNQSGTTENLITFTATATDADLPANTLTFSLDAGAPAGASITSGGVFTWTPTNVQTGDFSVTVRVTDNGSPVLDDFETITIHVDASNTAPVADNQSVSTPKNTPKPITLTASDSDVPAQTLSYAVVDGPDHGVLSGTEPNLVYTPNVNYVGPDSFTFKANDGLVDSNIATITIDVTQTPSMVISVYGSPAPNAFGSPSWPQYITNALTALETGATSVGDRNTDPSAYVQVTNAPWSDAVVGGFSCWRGVAGPLPPFDQEGGNRLHFGLRIQGNGTRFTLQDLEFAVESDDPSNDLEFAGDFIGANYSPTRKGIDYGPDRVKGTLDDITYTTGGGANYVDEIIYVGVGNAWDASFETGTDQEKLEAVRCYLENLAPIHVLAEYKIKDGSGGYFATGSTVVTIIPTNSLPVANDQTVGVDEDSFVGVTLTATDADNETLAYTVVDGPDHGTLSGTAPNLTYTPFPNYYGPDSFTFKATDCVGDSNIATVTINVANVNDDPILGAIGNQTVDEQVNLTFNLSSSDIDGGAPIYSMIGGPAGATLVGNVFSWTPSEAQGPNVYSVTFEVSDGAGGVDSETISITVNEVNVAPVLGAIGTQTVDELQTLNFNATATDADLPANGLTYSLEGTVPAGASITSGGAFSWTPSEAQGPNSYTFDVVVKDDGSPQLEDRETITINVNEVNVAPELAAIGNQTVDEMSLLTFTATATDADLPSNTLTYTLDSGAPAGASITSGGVFTWTPTEAQGPGVYSITVRVTDNGSPALDDFETIQVTVNEVPDAVSMALNLSVPGFAGGGNVIRGLEIRVGGSGGVNAPVSLDRDVTLDASGNATLVLTEADGLTAGAAYTFVSVRDPLHTIRRKVALNEASTDTYDATLSLMLGNMNKDNKVDIGDYVVFALRYGTTVVPDTPFDIPGNPPTHTPTFRHADLNGDGEVDIADYAILSGAFGTVGDGDVGGWGRENNEIRQKISVLDAIVEAGTSDVVKFDQDGDGWITFKELGFHP